MNLNIRGLIGCLSLILCSSTSCLAREWCGIVPLHSTRSDVIKLLGQPKHLLWDYRDYFDLDGETVTFEWIDPTCLRKYPVEPDKAVRPGDLVLNINVALERPKSKEELYLPDRKLYLANCHGADLQSCTCMDMHNDDGFAFTTSKDKVTDLAYGPSAEEFKLWREGHQACVSSR